MRNDLNRKLKQLYLSPKSDGTPRTYVELSNTLGISIGQISYALKKMNLIAGRQGWQNRKLSAEDIAAIIRMYTEKNADGTWTGITTISKHFNVTDTLIAYYLDRAGIMRRSAKEAHAHGKACRPIKNLPKGRAPYCRCGCKQRTQWSQRRNQWVVYLPQHQRPPKLYHNEIWLRNEYYNKNRTLQEIAAECGVNLTSVGLYAKRFNMQLRTLSENLLLRGSVSREKNPAWKGGTTPERARLYNEGHWRIVVKQVYARDNYRCQRCGAPKRKPRSIHAHHIKPWATNPALRFDLTNMITVCNPCHRWIHSLDNTQKDFLA